MLGKAGGGSVAGIANPGPPSTMAVTKLDIPAMNIVEAQGYDWIHIAKSTPAPRLPGEFILPTDLLLQIRQMLLHCLHFQFQLA
jgi:hypothetical protein